MTRTLRSESGSVACKRVIFVYICPIRVCLRLNLDPAMCTSFGRYTIFPGLGQGTGWLATPCLSLSVQHLR